MTERSASAEVRKCPHCRFKSKLRALFMGIRRKAHADADRSWATRKGPMALYWRCVGVYTGHIARLFRA